MIRACAAAILALLGLVGSALAQTANLTETTKSGECSRYTLDLTLTGNLFVTQEGGKQPVRLEAKARHKFAERTIDTDGGIPTVSVRYYDEATASGVTGSDTFERSLAADRRLVVARRGVNGLLCFSPAGPLTRDELDLVTEHFNPQCLTGLLPGKTVHVGDTWPLSETFAQAACLLDGVTKNTLNGKLVEVRDGLAIFSVEGAVEGIEQGAKVSLTIQAKGTFATANQRVTELNWKQSDDREQGPINPASRVEAAVTLRREILKQEPGELANLPAATRTGPPPSLTNLRYADPKGRYRFDYPREWHLTGQTGIHLVLRLLDRGDFIAQATVTVWKAAPPGNHSTAEEFKKAINEAPAWIASRVLEDGEVPTPAGRWLYRLAAEGKTENIDVVQTFYLLAGPLGNQLAVTITSNPDKVKAIGTRDLSLVNAIEFEKK